MALTPYTTPTNIISTLGVNPEDRPDLNDDTFRAKFDENAVNLAEAVNLLISELASNLSGKGASCIGIRDTASIIAATTVEAALAELANSISSKIDKAISATDANNLGVVGEVTFHQSVNTTANTPYSQGLVVATTGFIMTYKSLSTTGTQWYYVAGTSGSIPRVFIRALASNIWTSWVEIITANGGDMSGYLTFKGSAERGLRFDNGDGPSQIVLGDFPSVSTALVEGRLFRNTSTSGNKLFTLFVGNNTSSIAFRIQNGEIRYLNGVALVITAGSGSPEGVVTANIGSLYLRTDGSSGTAVYSKESGSGNTGWAPLPACSAGTNISSTSGTISVTMDGSAKTITPTGDCTFNATGGVIGQRVAFVITTSGTTSRTLTFGTNFRTTGTLATGTTTAKKFTVEFVYDGSAWCEISRTTAL